LTVLQRCSETGISLDEARAFGQWHGVMEKTDESRKLSWPSWATWALLAVIVTSAATIAATLYDIL
jgi:hypothetical protein